VKMAILAFPVARRLKLEEALRILISNKPRTTIPYLELKGEVLRTGTSTGLPMSMMLQVPNSYKKVVYNKTAPKKLLESDGTRKTENKDGTQKENSLKNIIVRKTGVSVFPPVVWPSVFGPGCPCIKIWLTLSVEVYNPLWFTVNVRAIKAKIHMVDPDGVVYWFLPNSGPDLDHRVAEVHDRTTREIYQQQVSTMKMDVTVGTSSAWRLYDEQQKKRLTLKINDGSVTVNFKGNNTGDEAFQLDLQFEMDYLKLGNSQAHCITSTGGGCSIRSCGAERNATCENGQCNCPGENMCAVEGRCVSVAPGATMSSQST